MPGGEQHGTSSAMANRQQITRPSPALIAARKREIAKRYARKDKRSIPLTFAAVRLSELNRLYQYRHGRELPATDDGLQAARLAVHHIGRLRDAARRIGSWLDYWTPWLDLASRERLIRDATEHPLRWRADKIAWKLRVTAGERQALNLRTIGAIDETRAERQAKARILKRERDQARRRAQGVKPRADYERNAIAKQAPWEAVGISRATWYRRRLRL